jgi:hypothetical protein
MDFLLTDDQVAVLDSMGTLLGRHAGPERLRDLGGDQPSYDHDLDKHIETAGFFDIAAPGSTNRLDAALVQEAISVALGGSATSYRLLVAPSLPVASIGPMAIVADGHQGPVRFGHDADRVVVLGDRDVRMVAPPPVAQRTASRLGWPIGQFTSDLRGEILEGVDVGEVLAWLRVALAVEMVGAMRFATELTVEYVKERRQFGRPIGSFQAVQHGLAECAVAVEGARWLALEAADTGTREAASTALTHAVEAVPVVFSRTHQYSGAIGFTQEYDLHLATMRLVALRAEAESLGRPATVSAKQRWPLD